jgi:hypothetical protein
MRWQLILHPLHGTEGILSAEHVKCRKRVDSAKSVSRFIAAFEETAEAVAIPASS